MAGPACIPFEVFANSKWPDYEWRVMKNGAPVDLTGKTVLMQVRLYEGAAGDPLLDLSSATGSGDRIEITAATDGRYRPVVGATDGDLPWTALGRPSGKNRLEFSYDHKINGDVTAFGPLYVNVGVTR